MTVEAKSAMVLTRSALSSVRRSAIDRWFAYELATYRF